MKKTTFTYAILASLLLTACSSNETKETDESLVQQVYDCVFPSTNTPAPGWVCDEPVPGLNVSAVGVAELSSAGMSFMKDMAAADARGRLAEQMQIQVQKMIKQYLGTTGVGKTETVDAVASSTIKTITSQMLTGSKIYKSRTGPNGRLYVLVGIDPNAKEKIIKSAVKTSMKNDRSLWQAFKSKQSFDEMAAGIAQQSTE
jgi:hypothetical protein